MTLKFNQSTTEDLEEHLKRCDRLFYPVLSSRVDIKNYAEKIKTKGNTIEYWQDGILIGCVAYYINDDENEVFITSVSVEEEYQSGGLAKNMLFDLENRINHSRIRLEVHKSNEKALSLYSKIGYKLDSNSGEFNILIK